LKNIEVKIKKSFNKKI